MGVHHPNSKGPHQSVGVQTPDLRGRGEAWKPISPTRGECGSSSRELHGRHRSLQVYDPNSRGHTEEWESITPMQGATQKRASPSLQIKGAAPKCGGPDPRLEGSVGAHHVNSRGHAEAWELFTQTREDTPK